MFVKGEIGSGHPGAFGAAAGDLDSGGDIEVAFTVWGDSSMIGWYENQGDPRKSWLLHVLKHIWKRANLIPLADLDGDGRRDLAALAERGWRDFRW